MFYFVFGGSHQGKWSYVKNNLVKEKTLYLDGHDAEIDLEWPEAVESIAFNAFHHWVKRVLAVEREPQPIIAKLIQASKGRELIIICDDLSCGLVSASPLDRRYRAVLGKSMQYLSAEADRVIRLLAGIEIILKDEIKVEE
ncbi:MAG: bifunctional adenosylcobinamide kinase/adenosylcobinamide-phosphate guanylyltransferase [Eubacteriales bacterium]|nr:bifunctional adenosylcobinamide kinase/adenosylcobinamide-phosphate guanylyltransferase [Eubacteriales bacterium]